MPDQEDSENPTSSRLDIQNVRVSVRAVEHPGSEDQAPEAWTIHSFDTAVPGDGDIQAVQELVYAESRAIGQGYPAPHVLRVQEEYTSWGADAAYLDVVLVLAEGAAGGV